MCGKEIEKSKPSYIASKKVKWTALMKKNLVAPQNVKQGVII